MRSTLLKILRFFGLMTAVVGLVLLALAPVFGNEITDSLWQVEPMAYVGAAVLLLGLIIALSGYLIGPAQRPANGQAPVHGWSRVTQDYFDTFSHDMGRPFRRILGKEREVRARVEESGQDLPPAVQELLDEIEQQAPSFRLMLANVRVLVELEDPDAEIGYEPVDPVAIVRNIADRYAGVAAERDAELTWWSEPAEFGLVYGDASALDHIVTNLVDNAVKYATRHVELRVTRNPTHYFIRVWDDGPGVPAAHFPHLFDRGWTPEMAGRRERTSSGLGLYIARTLARRAGGDIAVESATNSADREDVNVSHYTTMTVMLPLSKPTTEG